VKHSWRKYVASYLIIAMFIIGITPRVYAGFSPSEGISMLSFDRASDLEKVRKVLEMKMVREKLKELGFTPEEVEKKLSQLSDQQVHQLALNIDQLQVGGSSGWVILIVVLLIVVIIGVVIYVSGHRVVLEKEK